MLAGHLATIGPSPVGQPAAVDWLSAGRHRPPPPFPLSYFLFLSLFPCFSSHCPSPSSLGRQHGRPPPAGRTPPDASPTPVEAAALGPGAAGPGLMREPTRLPLQRAARWPSFPSPVQPVRLATPSTGCLLRCGGGASAYGARPWCLGYGYRALAGPLLPSSTSLSPSRLPCRHGGDRWCVVDAG